jgi:hypothetical protein
MLFYGNQVNFTINAVGTVFVNGVRDCEFLTKMHSGGFKQAACKTQDQRKAFNLAHNLLVAEFQCERIAFLETNAPDVIIKENEQNQKRQAHYAVCDALTSAHLSAQEARRDFDNL